MEKINTIELSLKQQSHEPLLFFYSLGTAHEDKVFLKYNET